MKLNQFLKYLNEAPMMDVSAAEQKEILANRDRKESFLKRKAEEKVEHDKTLEKAMNIISKKIARAKAEGKVQIEINPPGTPGDGVYIGELIKAIFKRFNMSVRVKRNVFGMGDVRSTIVIDIDPEAIEEMKRKRKELKAELKRNKIK